MIYGIGKVMFSGAELYRHESKNQETLSKFGHGTPDDWLERNIYTPYSARGILIMLFIDLALFGSIGFTIWAIQMAWIPFWAAGVVNGIGHYWGYRNYDCEDASTNIFPWGILIGGEELHNNHHTYPTSAKLSVKPYEFDIGWLYICILQFFGLATVKKTPPVLAYGEVRPVADEKTLEALITNRYEVMAGYARQMRSVFRQEVANAKLDASVLKIAARWIHRDGDKVPAEAQAPLSATLAAYPVLDKMLAMREELRQIWLNTSHNREQLALDLQAWCKRAEDSGIAALRDFSTQLRAARA
jgi:stearoyl-CoA desaturase (delta-9 desaturase)